jgi:type IV secretion system protein VirB5
MTLFKRPSVRYGKTPTPVTPYQKAAQVWDERIGSSRVQARNWRLMAFSCFIMSAGLGAGLVWQSTRGTVVPWVVEIDRLGAARAVAPASETYEPADAQIAWHLARFVENVRQLPADPIVLRQNWLRAYDFTTDRGALALNDHAREDEPFARVGEVQVAIEISSVIRASGDSFRVAWTERHYENGQLDRTERWTAILTVTVQPPRDAERLRKNPLGIFVRAISWSRETAQ